MIADAARTLEFQPQIIEAISAVYDPEIPVNIYELGLIYDIAVDADAHVEVKMTLTSPSCPSAQFIPSEVQRRIADVPGVRAVSVDVVWDPPWDKDRMSDVAKLQLGLL
jgi:FeS assembly SUF system protein